MLSEARGSSDYHAPAMAREVIEFLNPRDEGLWLDNTVGGGGHAGLICSRLGEGS
ncbi:MAG: 16S rRNA (cytosine(1402)-N(4))-methyltransferase, partial [Armatimonadota bacterium]